MHSNQERVHVNMDTHEYKIHPIKIETNSGGREYESSERLITYKGVTFDYREGYHENEMMKVLEVRSSKGLQTAIEKRSYMMLATIAVLSRWGVDYIYAEDTPAKNYHKFMIAHWVMSVEFSFLVRRNIIEFKSFRTSGSSLPYQLAIGPVRNANIVMENLQAIVKEINEVYQAFEVFKEKIDEE